MDKKTLAIGILIGIAVVGCLAALDGVAGTSGRYQFPTNWSGDSQYSSGRVPVLDTETGTLNWHFYSVTAPSTVVYPFLTDPVQ